MLTPGKGQIKALVTSCGNPVLSTPNGQQLDRALSSLDFMASIDFYVNETTRHADVILPPTCGVEHDHYDLLFLHLAVRNVTRYTEAVVSPAEGALHDWQIYSELARRYARRIWASEKGGVVARLKGMGTRAAMARLAPKRLLQIGLQRGNSGVTWDDMKHHPEGIDLGPLKPSLVAALQAKGKRIKLLPERIAQELPTLVPLFTQAPSAQDTLKLIGRRDVRSNNSWMHNSERLTKGRTRFTVQMHPDDAAARGLGDGDVAVVSTSIGSIEAPVEVTDRLLPGVVSVPHGYGHDRAGTPTGWRRAASLGGASVNDITDSTRIDPLSGNAAVQAVPVSVARAEG
jgi:anaerobic selenocysteine-containing dehydrogenase